MKYNNKDRSSNSKYLKGGEDTVAISSRKFPTDAVQAIPLEVAVFNNFDRAFKVFRTLVQRERTLSLYKEKQSFEKASDKKRRKRNESRRKQFELEIRNEKILSGEFEKDKIKKDASREKRRKENSSSKEE